MYGMDKNFVPMVQDGPRDVPGSLLREAAIYTAVHRINTRLSRE